MTFTEDGNYREIEVPKLPIITKVDFDKFAPRSKWDLSAYLSEACEMYGIISQQQIAAFMAQICHESDGFRTTKEYASGRAYEFRKDLGNTTKGDGVKYKGRGLIQITGKSNYAKASQAIFNNDTLITEPNLLELPRYASLVSGWYWKWRNLNRFCDGTEEGFEKLTKAINGGLNGLADRLKHWDRAKGIWVA